VNMDNYYISTTVAINLKNNGVYYRFTIRMNRMFLPKSVLFTASEARNFSRGTTRLAVNMEHSLIAVG